MRIYLVGLFVLFSTNVIAQKPEPCYDKKKQLYGYCDEKEQVVITHQYKYADYFGKETAIVVDTKNRYGAINEKGELVLVCKWDYAENFTDTSFAVRSNGKYGIIGKSGHLIVDTIYTSIAKMVKFPEQMIVEKDGKYGVLNDSGKLIFPFYTWEDDYLRTIHNDYLNASPMPTSFATVYHTFRAVNAEGKMGIFNFSLKTLFDFKHEYVNYTSFYDNSANDSIIIIGNKDLYSFIDRYEKNVFGSTQFTNVYFDDYDNTVPICVQLTTKIQFIDAKNWRLSDECPENLLNRMFYVYPDPYPSHRNERVLQDVHHQLGVIDVKGDIIVPFIYDQIDLKKDYAIVTKDNKTGVIDLNGKTYLAPMENVWINTINYLDTLPLKKTIFTVKTGSTNHSDFFALYKYSEKDDRIVQKTEARFTDVYLEKYDTLNRTFTLKYIDKEHPYDKMGKMNEHLQEIK